MADSLKTLVIDDATGAREDVLGFLHARKPGRPPLAAEKWVWRYVDGPAGKGIITVMVDTADGDRIVGHNALALNHVVSGGEVFTVGISGGLRVEEAYRSRGVFVRMRKAEEEKVKARGLPLLATHPNDMATPGYRLTGYRFHQRFEFALKAIVCVRPDGLWRPVRLAQQAGLYLLNRAARSGAARSGPPGRPPEDLRIERLEAFGAETDGLWARVGRRDYLGIVKDAEYLTWRYGKRPGMTYDAHMGYVKDEPRALCIIEWQTDAPRAGWVAELLARPEDEDAALAVLAYAERHAARSGVWHLRALADGVSVTGSVLNRMGYLRQSVRPFLVRMLDEARGTPLTGPWCYSMGDFQVGA